MASTNPEIKKKRTKKVVVETTIPAAPKTPSPKTSPSKLTIASPSKQVASPKKSPSKAEVKAVQEEVKELAQVIDESVDKTESPTLIKRLENLYSRVGAGDIAYHKISKELKTIKKEILKLQKQSTKKDTTKKRSSGVLSGIQKPGKLSDDMYRFTGFDPEKEYSRVDVTKFICNYIREKNLQNPEDKRLIMIENDPELMHVLNYSSDDKKLSYPLIQKYIKVHIQNDARKKKADAAAVAAE